MKLDHDEWAKQITEPKVELVSQQTQDPSRKVSICDDERRSQDEVQRNCRFNQESEDAWKIGAGCAIVHSTIDPYLTVATQPYSQEACLADPAATAPSITATTFRMPTLNRSMLSCV